MTQNKSRILVSIPTYNEYGNIERLIRNIHDQIPNADLLFIDDNSPDGSGELLDGLAKKDIRIHVMHRTKKSGIGSALKAAFEYTCKHGYDYLITMDADFLHDPRYLPIFVEKAHHADIVIGSRYALGGTYKGIGSIRKRFTYFWRWVIGTALGLKYDSTGSFRLYSNIVLDPKIYTKISARGFEFNMEALYYFKQAGARIVEFPIEAQGRLYGESKLTYREMLFVLKKLLHLTWDRITN